VAVSHPQDLPPQPPHLRFRHLLKKAYIYLATRTPSALRIFLLLVGHSLEHLPGGPAREAQVKVEKCEAQNRQAYDSSDYSHHNDHHCVAEAAVGALQQVDCKIDHEDGEIGDEAAHEHAEVFVVSTTDAITQERTVMVKDLYAILTPGAVARPPRPVHEARFAKGARARGRLLQKWAKLLFVAQQEGPARNNARVRAGSQHDEQVQSEAGGIVEYRQDWRDMPVIGKHEHRECDEHADHANIDKEQSGGVPPRPSDAAVAEEAVVARPRPVQRWHII